jgi:prepilin-type processing-associated H-X9-DG protein
VTSEAEPLLHARWSEAIVAFLQSLEGEGYQDKAPQMFPQQGSAPYLFADSHAASGLA